MIDLGLIIVVFALSYACGFLSCVAIDARMVMIEHLSIKEWSNIVQKCPIEGFLEACRNPDFKKLLEKVI